MGLLKKLDRFFSGIEWKLSLGTVLWGLIVPAGSFALPAWGVKMLGHFSEYAPLSWIVAGFSGLLLYAVSVALIGFGRGRNIRAKYNARLIASTGGVDPMAKVFEDKRIFLNDFVLPSNPSIESKTFVNCEIVGPANLYLQFDNNIRDIRIGKIDAVALKPESVFLNGIFLRNCTFRGCTFHRVTLFFSPTEAPANQHLEWINWITPLPDQGQLPGTELTSIEDQRPQQPQDTQEDTPPKTSRD